MGASTKPYPTQIPSYINRKFLVRSKAEELVVGEIPIVLVPQKKTMAKQAILLNANDFVPPVEKVV